MRFFEILNTIFTVAKTSDYKREKVVQYETLKLSVSSALILIQSSAASRALSSVVSQYRVGEQFSSNPETLGWGNEV